MRRLILLFLSALSCACLVACEMPSNQDSLPIALQNQADKTTIYLGMDKKSVEELLGEGTLFDIWAVFQDPFLLIEDSALPDRDGFQDFSYGEGQNYLTLTYCHGYVSSMTAHLPTRKEVTSNWRDNNGLSCGRGSKEDIVKHYGEAARLFSGYTPERRLVTVYQYFFDAEETAVDDAEHAFWSKKIAFYEDDGSIYSISLFSMDAVVLSREHTPETISSEDKRTGLDSISAEDTLITPYAVMSVTHSAEVTQKRYEYAYTKNVFDWENTAAETRSGEFSSTYPVRNSYHSDILGAKTAIETAVDFDVKEKREVTWKGWQALIPAKR